MTDYVVEVLAESEAAATPSAYIVIQTPDDVSVCLKKLHVSTSEADIDDQCKVQIRRVSAKGSGSTTGSPHATRVNAPEPYCSTFVKDGATLFVLGADPEIIETFIVYGRSPGDWFGEFWSNPGEDLEITITRTDATIDTLVSVTWGE